MSPNHFLDAGGLPPPSPPAVSSSTTARTAFPSNNSSEEASLKEWVRKEYNNSEIYNENVRVRKIEIGPQQERKLARAKLEEKMNREKQVDGVSNDIIRFGGGSGRMMMGRHPVKGDGRPSSTCSDDSTAPLSAAESTMCRSSAGTSTSAAAFPLFADHHDPSTPDDKIDVISNKMAKTTVFFVSNDCSTVSHFERCCTMYNVHLKSFVDFDGLDEYVLLGNLDQNRTYMVLTNENQYSARSYKRLSSKANKKSVLLTFGPGHRSVVAESQGHYYYDAFCLTNSETLMASLASHVVGGEPQEQQEVSSSVQQQELATMDDSMPDYFSYIRVLVAEDNMVNQKILGMMLKKLGFVDVDMVVNGQEALDKEAEKEYDIVLLDMHMPIMDGLTACRYIKKERYPNGDGPKVAFVTAHVDDQDFIQETTDAGSDAILSKPFAIKEIETCLRELLL